MLFQTLSALSFHQLSSWAICFLFLYGLTCSLCPVFAVGPVVHHMTERWPGLLGRRIHCSDFQSWRQQKRNHSLDFLPMSVATWNADLLSNVFGNKCCKRFGRAGWGPMGADGGAGVFESWAYKLREAGEEKNDTGWDTKGRKTRNRDYARRGHKEVRHREKGQFELLFYHMDRKTLILYNSLLPVTASGRKVHEPCWFSS